MDNKNTPNKMEEKRKRIVLALVLSSYLIVGIDGSLVITAIAQIASELHMDNMTKSGDHFQKIVIVGNDIHRKEDKLGVFTVSLLDFLTDKNLLEQG